MKLATAAGIQFHPEYTTVTRENTNTYVGKAYGAVRLPDGSYKTHAETKRICLDDEKSIEIEYLEGLNERYEKWIAEYPGKVLVIDADGLDFQNRPEDFASITDKIDSELYGLF